MTQNDFDISKCLVRIAVTADEADLKEIASTIWDGSDYLPDIMGEWIAEPWFLVCEYEGRVIACLKMTMLPDKVLWFEGLRVHGDFQNRGLGTLMNQHAMRLAQQLSNSVPGLAYEFCTYYKNVESLHLTAKLGFETVTAFHVMDHKGGSETRTPELIPSPTLDLFSHYPRYIPLGWRILHHHPEALELIIRKGSTFRGAKARFLLGGIAEKYALLLDEPDEDFAEELPYLQHFAGKDKNFAIILATAFAHRIPMLKELGFDFWDEEEDYPENMVVLRLNKLPGIGS